MLLPCRQLEAMSSAVLGDDWSRQTTNSALSMMLTPWHAKREGLATATFNSAAALAHWMEKEHTAFPCTWPSRRAHQQ